MAEVQFRLEGARVAAFQEATRVQQNIIANSEKRVLVWLAARTPQAINSDHLTALGAVGMLLTGASYAFARYNRYGLLFGCLFLAINWLGDSLDGTLARCRNCQRPRYGFYVDHVIDCFGITALFAGMGSSGYMHPMLAACLLIAYLLLSSEIFLATYAIGKFEMSHVGLGPTELRILLCIGNVYLFFWPSTHPFGLQLSLFDFGAVVAAIGMVAVALSSALKHGRALYDAERLK